MHTHQHFLIVILVPLFYFHCSRIVFLAFTTNKGHCCLSFCPYFKIIHLAVPFFHGELLRLYSPETRRWLLCLYRIGGPWFSYLRQDQIRAIRIPYFPRMGMFKLWSLIYRCHQQRITWNLCDHFSFNAKILTSHSNVRFHRRGKII